MESISADFDVKASSKPYEINLEEQKDIKGRTLSWKSGHLSCFPDHWQVLSLHLFESTSSINWVVRLDGSCWLKILHYFIFGMISDPGGDKRNWRQEVWFGLIELNQVDDFPAPILFFIKLPLNVWPSHEVTNTWKEKVSTLESKPAHTNDAPEGRRDDKAEKLNKE